MSACTRKDAQNWADWRYFRKRGPVNFMRPRAQQCRINKLIVSWLVPDEARRLLSAKQRPLSEWETLCNDIEERLLAEGTLKRC